MLTPAARKLARRWVATQPRRDGVLGGRANADLRASYASTPAQQ